MLTGHPDTDTKILLSLNLQDVRRYCQTNSYSSHLCRTRVEILNKLKSARAKVTTSFNILETKRHIMLQSEKVTFETYYNLTDYIGGMKPTHHDIEDYLEEMYSVVSIIDVTYDPTLKAYMINFYTGSWGNDVGYIYFIQISLSKFQLEEYLLYLFYNDIVITF